VDPALDEKMRESAARARSTIQRGRHEPSAFREAILGIPPGARDAWLDAVLGLGALPEDGPDLPRHCVPYLPCPVEPLLRVVDRARVGPADVFVDVGSGLGRAAMLVHLLTGAGAIGLEVQSRLAAAARDMARRLVVPRVATVQGDAASLARFMTIGSVFFLYCPFSGARVDRVLGGLEGIARTRTIRVCAVDVPLPPRAWLALEPPPSGDLAVYRSTFGL
jgi:Histone methylation protein DOT1